MKNSIAQIAVILFLFFIGTAQIQADETAKDGVLPAYLVVQLEVTHPQEFGRYQMAALPSLMKAGAVPLSAGGQVDVLEGETMGNVTVMLKFPSLDAAQSWYHSDEYQKVIPIRKGAVAKTNMMIVEGFVPPMPKNLSSN